VASLPKVEQQQILRQNPHLLDEWDVEFGDRHTKLVFIGVNLQPDEIIEELDKSLLTDTEFDEDWSAFPDPFCWNLQRS
jgi:hypothetical protein